jgi:hypothetical protein
MIHNATKYFQAEHSFKQLLFIDVHVSCSKCCLFYFVLLPLFHFLYQDRLYSKNNSDYFSTLSFFYWKWMIICMLTKYIVNLLCIFHRKTFCYDWHKTSSESSSQFLVGFVLLNIYFPWSTLRTIVCTLFSSFWSLYCLFVALRLLTTPFATSNFSFQQW